MPQTEAPYEYAYAFQNASGQWTCVVRFDLGHTPIGGHVIYRSKPTLKDFADCGFWVRCGAESNGLPRPAPILELRGPGGRRQR